MGKNRVGHKESLKSQIERLKPLDCEEKVEKLIGILTERNTNVDCYLDKWICSLIENNPLVDYYKKRSVLLKRTKQSTDTMPYIADLLVKYYPVDNVSKVNAIYDELTKNDLLLCRSDFDFASNKIIGKKSKEQWEKRYNEGREIKIEVENRGIYKIISVAQPMASLLVTGAVKEIKIENYYILHEGDNIYVYADRFSSEMMNKVRYDIKLLSTFSNGIFTGSYQEDNFPEKCYVGKFVIGEKVSKGVEEVVNPEVFNSPIETQLHCSASKLLAPSHHFEIKHIELSGRTIIVPVNDETWSQLENKEESVFFYWEESFDKIIRYKSLDEYKDEMWDDEGEYNDYIEGIAGDEQGLYDILFLNRKRHKLYKQVDERAVRSEYYVTQAGDYFKALLFDFENIKYVNEEKAFDILQKKDWILDWNCVRFKNGMMIVSAPLDGSVRFKPKAVHLPGAMEAYNYLTAYINERLAPVHCSVEKMELTIYDTIRLNEAIQKFATVSRQKGISVVGNIKSGGKSIPQQMSFKQALSKAQQMTPEEFTKYKSKYIDYLVTIQSEKYKVIPCVERLAHTNSDMTEYAFMFSIECSSGKILIVHENVNPDRSTLLFLVKQESFNKSIREIYDFLQSAEINKRSSLREKNIEIENAGILSYRSINHDDLFSWKQIIITYKRYR